jgi:SanA protein
MLCIVKSGLFRVSVLILLIVSLGLLPRKLVEIHYGPKIFSLEAAPSRGTAIVFGAGLRGDGTPSIVLADRVTVATRLYFDEKISSILMSGSMSPLGFDEPAAMRDLAISLGVPTEAILVDHKGTRTFDTCQRAKEVFSLDGVILVSQGYHLPRALTICDALGLDAVAVSADLRSYHPRAMQYWKLREIPATIVALWDAFIANSLHISSEQTQTGDSIQGIDYGS